MPYILDIVTVTLLTNNQIDNLFNAKLTNKIDESHSITEKWHKSIEKISKKLPSISNKENSFLYFEPQNKQCENLFKNNGFDIEIINDFYKKNSKLLRKLRLNQYSYNSLLNQEVIFSSQLINHPWGRLSFINISSKYDPNTKSHMGEPSWISNILLLKRFYRTYYWLRHRERQILSFNKKLKIITQMLILTITKRRFLKHKMNLKKKDINGLIYLQKLMMNYLFSI